MHDPHPVTPDLPALQSFQRVVLADPLLQAKLRRTADRQALAALVVVRARERGCILDAAQVEVALDAGLRTWMRQIRYRPTGPCVD